MQIIIGTLDERKIKSLKKIITEIIREKSMTVRGYKAASGVPETPWNEQTYFGARNRAIACQQEYPPAEYSIGLENGLVERYGHVFEETWCCIINQDRKECYGYSSGLPVPTSILKRMTNEKLEHNQVMKLIQQNKNAVNDTWGTYSGNMILREISLEEAIRNAFVQLFPNEGSLYQ